MWKKFDKDKAQAVYDSLKIYCFYILVPAVFIIAGMMIRKVNMPVEEFMDQSGDFYTVLGFGGALFLLYRRCKNRGISFMEEAFLYPKEMTRKTGTQLFMLGLGISLLLSAALTVLPIPGMAAYAETSGKLFRGPDQILVFLSVLFLAPAAEEIIFRGFIMGRLQKEFTVKQSVIISSLLFAVLHAHPVWILYAFFMACLMGYAAASAENVCCSIAVHMGFNMASIPIMWINNSQVLKDVFFGSKVLVFLYGCIGGAIVVVMLKVLKNRREEQWLKIL